MNIDKLNKWFTLVANLGVLVGIIFLGLEVRQNTSYLRRGEMNTTFDQATTSRVLAMQTDVAELLVKAQQGSDALSDVDVLRLDTFYDQWVWTSYQIYDRERGGYIDEGEWERGGKAIILGYIGNPVGRSWWELHRNSYPPDFSAIVDEALASVPFPAD